ncbi:MAG: hypothetical protein KBC12_00630 [Candidatus Pacebacteria bacterium]|jgi:hypothetical protein|nr:hypothetical protein [Candidatus Paceibacterota bacterium]MBP9851156.1 hypothetical protein [Candidatus Paceibacterota bacterium]
MINLIPNEEKKKMAKDFYFRIVVMFFTVLSLSLIIGSFALLPSYMLSSEKQKFVKQRLDLQSYMPLPASSQDVLDVARSLNTKFKIIDDANENKFDVSERVIKKIVAKKTPGIKITQISYKTDNFGEKSISIRGSATSRDTLLSFSQSLDKDSEFKKVDLPISNFIKGSDIQFFINLIPS